MRAPAFAVALVLLATPAFAQFPPPGIYACVDSAGAAIGKLNLLVAGDYSFDGADGSSGSGQVASAANNVTPVSGPLKEMGWIGAFETDEQGKTAFRFTGSNGEVITCR